MKYGPAVLVFGQKTKSVTPMVMQPFTNFNLGKRVRRKMSLKRCYDRHDKSLLFVTIGEIIHQSSPKKTGKVAELFENVI